MKKILITGAGGYIGTNMIRFLQEFNRQTGASAAPDACYLVDTLSLRGNGWESFDFAGYDSVLHLAGKAHADIGGLSKAEQQAYYEINCNLAVRTAAKAKAAGVPQFIYMSSVIVYGDSAGVGKNKHITADTQPSPANFYGDSKWQAERKLCELEQESQGDFRVAIVRSPMVYGAGSKGNFPMLVKLAAKTPVFPDIHNERSMIYIENLTEFLRLLIESGQGGVFLPQNEAYVTTARMVQAIGGALGRQIRLTKLLKLPVRIASAMPGKLGNMANKAFGSLTVEQGLTGELTGYQICDLEESIRRSVEHGKNEG
ncbi:MAG: NAD-dependent epimerase/dehydratase family protein [Lachnospiraceae bacterium]|nr:NAD-dependent epimerase/dehydratase family protein [Lachnospiraceae bacterium]